MKKASRDWALPVTDWKIIIRFKQNDYPVEHEFYSISHLANYFQNLPEVGVLFKYCKELPQHRLRQNYLACSEGEMILWYVEDKEYCFKMEDAYAMAHYLDHHPNIARALSYSRKN